MVRLIEFRFAEIHFWMRWHEFAQHVLFLLLLVCGEPLSFLALIEPILRVMRSDCDVVYYVSEVVE